MTDTDVASATQPKRPKKKRGKRREPWRQKAERHGVSTRTLDRWAAAGIIDPPEKINGRKYGDADEEPRTDAPEGRSLALIEEEKGAGALECSKSKRDRPRDG